MHQFSMFDIGQEPYKINKPVRLIELFAGIGAQAKALERLGVPFEHYRICEFDKYAVQSYNAIHGTSFETSDITQIGAEDLGIVETDKYEYITTYSFPCTDLSIAGKREGMAKGSGTRSGLLWEVERLLKECKELPQILLMENVPQVLNMDFGEWLEFLESLGYKNYYKILNAKDYGIPQNRQRCYMVSILGEGYYEFPKKEKLTKCLKDLLEEEVDEKYYLSKKQVKTFKADNKEVSNTVRSGGRGSLDKHSWDLVQIGSLNTPGRHESACRVYSSDGLAPTINTMQGGGLQPKILEKCKQVEIVSKVTVRKYEIDTSTLKNLLRSHRKLSIKEISEKMNLPRTKIEHWFRNDDSFAIPDPEYWLKLKTILEIKTDEFDHPIMDFIEKNNCFESNNRAYADNGISPTLTANNNTQIIEQSIEKVAKNQYGSKALNETLENNSIDDNDFIDAYNRNIRKDGIAGTITTRVNDSNNVFVAKKDKQIKIKNATKKGYLEAEEGDSINLAQPNSKTRRGRVGKGVAQTITTMPQQAAINNNTIRKLTPLECWRLMDFDDIDFYNAKSSGVSDSQLYKQAGNSIVVKVLVAIFKMLFR